MKKRRINRATNALDPATTTNKDWGFIPVAGKGGKTTNFQPDLSVNEAAKLCYGRKVVD